MNTSYDMFGVECGPGWRKLIEPLFEQARKEGVDVLQVKEKFGGLRFYVSSASQEFNDMIDQAEHDSFEVCEQCGEPGYKDNDGGYWIRTLCDEHHKEIKKRNASL